MNLEVITYHTELHGPVVGLAEVVVVTIKHHGHDGSAWGNLVCWAFIT